MSNWLIALVGFIYLCVCVGEYRQGNTGMAIVFFGYSIANVGLILATARLL